MSRSVWRAENRVMVVALAATTVALLPVFLASSLAARMGADLGYAAPRLGLSVAGFFGASALCAALLGGVADRFGSVTVIRVSGAWVGLSLVAIGMCSYSWISFSLLLALAGVSNGVMQPAANRYLMLRIRQERRGWAFGVKQAAIPAATLAAGAAVPAIGDGVTWRMAFVLAAIMTSLLVVAVPRPVASPSPAEPRGKSRPVDQHRSSAPLMVLSIGAGIASSAAGTLGVFFIIYAVSLGNSDSYAALVACAGSVASIIARLAIGRVADRWHSAHLAVVAGMCAFGSVGFVMLALAQESLLLVGALFGWALGWGWAGLLTYAIANMHMSQPAKATSMTQAATSFGSCAGPLAFGLVVAHASYQSAWALFAALLAAGGAIILGGRKMALVGEIAGGEA